MIIRISWQLALDKPSKIYRGRRPLRSPKQTSRVIFIITKYEIAKATYMLALIEISIQEMKIILKKMKFI